MKIGGKDMKKVLILGGGCARCEQVEKNAKKAKMSVSTLLNQILDENPPVGYIIMKNLAFIVAARLRNTNMLFRGSIIW